MRSLIKFSQVLITGLLASCSDYTMPQETYNPNQPVNIDVFYTQLSPYGNWVTYSNYGYVWVPEVTWGFTPYSTNGHWIYTRYGWTWYSYYPWGWATFHYGRWVFDIAYGWMWIPDIIWGPAWVAWRSGPGYYGWAPLGPGISVNIIVSGGHIIPHEHWCFVKENDFYDNHVDRHRIDRSQNSSMIERSSMVRNIRQERNEQYLAGPDRDEIQRYTPRRIDQVGIVERNRPGTEKLRNNQLEIFKPFITPDLNNRDRQAPQRVMPLDELKRQDKFNVPTNPSTRDRQPPRKIQSKPPIRQNNPQPKIRTRPAKPTTTPRKKGN